MNFGNPLGFLGSGWDGVTSALDARERTRSPWAPGEAPAAQAEGGGDFWDDFGTYMDEAGWEYLGQFGDQFMDRQTRRGIRHKDHTVSPGAPLPNSGFLGLAQLIQGGASPGFDRYWRR